MDFEAAYKQEHAARLEAESILQKKSRDLHNANQYLRDNIDTLKFALRENQFLVHIGRYGIEKPRLRDFLPTLVFDMLRLSDMLFAVYFHFPFDASQGDYRSEVIRNPDLFGADVAGVIQDNEFQELDNIVTQVEVAVREDNGCDIHLLPIYLPINGVEIDTLVALPIVSLNYLGGIIILFGKGLTEKQNQVLKVFYSGITQLAIMMEHRYQEDKLISSYEEVKVANEALKEAQKKLVQSEKMATVGQLSAGIAHEINNPMGFIKSNMGSLNEYVDDFVEYVKNAKQLSDLAQQSDNDMIAESAQALDAKWRSLDMDFLIEDCHSLLSESQQGVKRILDIVGGLKRFSRQTDDKKSPCNLHDTIEEALKLAHNELKYNVTVIKHFAPVKPVLAKSGELLQVFLNLFVNASHAMSEQGELMIMVEEENQGVRIKVADTGSGIDPKHLNSIFDPFFTTKDVGVGTGLGLSISYGIIEEHNGSIEVKSDLGVGTEFSIWLPYSSNELLDEEVA